MYFYPRWSEHRYAVRHALARKLVQERLMNPYLYTKVALQNSGMSVPERIMKLSQASLQDAWLNFALDQGLNFSSKREINEFWAGVLMVACSYAYKQRIHLDPHFYNIARKELYMDTGNKPIYPPELLDAIREGLTNKQRQTLWKLLEKILQVEASAADSVGRDRIRQFEQINLLSSCVFSQIDFKKLGVKPVEKKSEK